MKKAIILTGIMFVLLFAATGAMMEQFFLSEVKSTSYEAVLQMVSRVREVYPDVSEEAVIASLNGQEDTTAAKQMLKEYGIFDTDWAVLGNRAVQQRAAWNNAVFCLAGGSILLLLWAWYRKCEKQEIYRMTGYLAKINSGHYDLNIKDNREGTSSVLQNEIYKTMVHLREQCQHSVKDKISLKNSIFDISHQLKTPLTSMMLLLDNLTENSQMPKEIQQEFLGDIYKTALHISFLVQSLLKLSQLDANAVDFTKKPEKLRDILQSCLDKTELLAEVREVAVSVQCDENSLLCDKRWIVEALTNIVKNCIEHTPSGGTVTLRAEDNRFDTKIIISDTGSGIAAEDLPHIFERFYKAKNADENSLGIGLALSKAIITQHDGYITVDSTVGKGSVFTIKFLKIEV